MAKGILIGKRPTDVTITLEGRNSYDHRHIAVLVTNTTGKQWAVLNIYLEDIKDFVAQLNAAYKVAQSAADTTPAGYRERQARVAATIPGLPAGVTPELLAKALAALTGTAQAPVASTPPQVPVAAPTAPVDDLTALANILGVIQQAQVPKKSTRKRS